MQKKLIALAVAAAFSAPAFADVNVYGVVDATLAHVSADGQKSDLQVLSGGLAASRIGVTGAEDLNNGMKAIVKLEYGLDTAIGDGLAKAAARQQMLALAGDFGTFATGYLQTTGYDFGVKFDPMAGSAVSPLSAVTSGFLIGDNAVAKRAQRALAYISPDMAGVTVAVNYSTGLTGVGDLGLADTATVQKKSTAYLLSATYTGVQNLAIGVVYTGATLGTGWTGLGAETSTLAPKEYALGASYDLGVVKLFGTYQSFKSGTNSVQTTEESKKAMSFSAVAPVGPGAIAFSYAKTSNITDAITGAKANGKGMAVAWLQGLSKTTTFYAALEKVSNDSGTGSFTVLNGAVAPVTAGGSSTVLAVGLNKKF